MDRKLRALRNLKQRKVVQWALAYAAGAWLFLEAFDLIAEQFLWPHWVRQGATVLLAFGLLIAIVLAWQHGERGRQRVGPGELLLLATLLALGAGSVWALKKRSDRLGIEGAERADFALRADPPPENSVAVLPCTNLGADERGTMFADGLAAELITRLSAVRRLRVPSQTSSFTFKGKGTPIEEVASALRVRHVLECGVAAEGTRLRVATRLVDGRTGYALWSETYDRETGELLDVQREIAQAVVGWLQVELQGAEPARLARRWTDDPEAYEQFLRGLQFQLREPSAANVEAARRHLERAVELDPAFARGYARLAVHWIVVGNVRLADPAEAYAEAKRFAETALGVDDQLYEAYWARGWVALAFEYRWEAAREDFQRTIALAPGEFAGYHSLGFVEGVLGRIDRGLEAARIAVDLDPLAYWPRSGVAILHTRRRDWDAAARVLETLTRTIVEDPSYLLVDWAIALAYGGREEEASARMAEARSAGLRDPGNRIGEAVFRTVMGDSAGAAAIVDSIETGEAVGTLRSLAGELAAAHAALGHDDRAMRWLEEARDHYHIWVLFLDRPELDALRHDPRFAELVHELRLPAERYLRPGRAGTDPSRDARRLSPSPRRAGR